MADTVDKLSDEDLAALHEMQGQLSKSGDPRAAKLQQYIDTQAPPTKEHGIIGRAWDWANKGLISGDTLANIAGKFLPKPEDGKPGESSADYIKREANSPPDPDHPYLNAAKVGLAGAAKDTYDMASSFTSPLSIGTMAAGAATKAPQVLGRIGAVVSQPVANIVSGGAKVAKVAAPLIATGFAGKGAADVAENAGAAVHGDPDAAQKALQGGAMVAGGGAGLKATVPEAYGVAKEGAAALRPAGPQTSVMPRIGNMPLKTVNAAEGIFQAAAPTGTNVKFRASVYTALPDLAEVARKVNLDEAKGGIINPDMRVRATVDAIDAHLADMYKTELKPQIDAHAGETVQPNLSYDAKAGLRFLSKSSGQVGDRFLAAKALNGQAMTVAELDRLRLVTNEELTPLRNMTPQDRAMAQVTNKKMAGLQALDGNVGDSLNNYLQSKGEPGIKGYEQRYAALSDVRNGLRPRINAEELKRNIDLGVIGKGIKAVTGGKAGIASASQAAVADVNVGKKLQSSLQTLAESDLKPNRAIRQVSPTSTQSLPGQSQ